ncbi:MAG TPA: ABC transporter permease subunit, partial [Anaerolineae bacterium]|nr:ABC transporter permease subunit [Anaerolineae bacterium]
MTTDSRSIEIAQAQLTVSDRVRLFFIRPRGDSPFRSLWINALLIMACIIAIYPALRVFTISLRPNDQLFSLSLDIIPKDATLANYSRLFSDKNFLVWIWNSLLVTVFVSVLGVSMAATSAYAFSRFRFRGRNISLLFLLTTQMIPAGMLLIPIYLFLARVGLLDTYKGILLAYVVSSIPFSIWILKGYYDTVPVDLEEAAMIDGASRLVTFLRIILPLSTPALAIVFLFNFMQSWQEFPVAYQIVQRKELLWTWPLGIKAMQGQFQTEWGMYAAASFMIMIPVLALFLYSAKWLISGLTLG